MIPVWYDPPAEAAPVEVPADLLDDFRVAVSVTRSIVVRPRTAALPLGAALTRVDVACERDGPSTICARASAAGPRTLFPADATADDAPRADPLASRIDACFATRTEPPSSAFLTRLASALTAAGAGADLDSALAASLPRGPGPPTLYTVVVTWSQPVRDALPLGPMCDPPGCPPTRVLRWDVARVLRIAGRNEPLALPLAQDVLVQLFDDVDPLLAPADRASLDAAVDAAARGDWRAAAAGWAGVTASADPSDPHGAWLQTVAATDWAVSSLLAGDAESALRAVAVARPLVADQRLFASMLDLVERATGPSAALAPDPCKGAAPVTP